MKVSFLIVSVFFLIMAARAQAQEPKAGTKKGNVIYKYKKYESFDLGNLEVKGDIIAPGDISVQQRQRAKMERGLLERPDFDREIRRDIKNLR